MPDKEMLQYYLDHVLGENDKFKFSCKQCESCCRNRAEAVVITGVDIYYMAKELEITPHEFVRNNTHINIGPSSRLPVVSLAERLDGSCRMLRNGKCMVHKSKPSVCAIYPLGRMVINGGDHFSYFTQENCCPGCYGAEEHTVKEWVGSFNLEQRDPECIRWNKLLDKMAHFMIKYEKKMSDEIKEVIHKTMFVLLYVGYDTDKSLIDEIEKAETGFDRMIELYETVFN